MSSAERIQEMMRKFEEQAQKASQLQSAMQDMHGTASSPDGSVTVTVAPSGAVLDLRLAPNAVRRSAGELQQQIMAAIREATASAAQQMNETVAPILGDNFDQFQEAFNAQSAVLKPPAGEEAPAAPQAAAPQTPAAPQTQPASPPRTAPQTPPARPQRSGDDDFDDDFSSGSFLR